MDSYQKIRTTLNKHFGSRQFMFTKDTYNGRVRIIVDTTEPITEVEQQTVQDKLANAFNTQQISVWFEVI